MLLRKGWGLSARSLPRPGLDEQTAALLGLAAHLGQELIMSQPPADSVRGSSRALAKRSEPSLNNVRRVTLLRTRSTPGKATVVFLYLT